MSSTSVSVELRQLEKVIKTSIQACIDQSGGTQRDDGPSRELFDARRSLIAAAGKIVELMSEPNTRLQEMATQYYESRALHIVADRRVPDLLAGHNEDGVNIESLANTTGIEKRKLSRIMRLLCSNGLFREVAPGYFANNRITVALVDNEPLRAYMLIFGLQFYSASDDLPWILNDPIKGHSYAVECTPLQTALGSKKPMWDWLEENVTVKSLRDGHSAGNVTRSPYPGVFGATLEEATHGHAEDDIVPRPELGVFGSAMIGGGNSTGQAHVYDFPWGDLGAATVVDVGAGAGGFCLQLSQAYPDLNFVIQDRPPIVAKAESEIWPKENPTAIKDGTVKFMPHDFFKVNPVKKADVYWLRYIMHDWSDDYCLQILAGVRVSMGPKSRLLLCEFIMTSTLGCDDIPLAPEPLPANWGYFTRYAHARDIAMMSVINGMERTPEEYKSLIETAGLKIRKIWDCRSSIGLIEAVLPGSEV